MHEVWHADNITTGRLPLASKWEPRGELCLNSLNSLNSLNKALNSLFFRYFLGYVLDQMLDQAT